ncbi:PREDICTED: heparan sulfate 2-O-sulfotransferase 1-like, partial [Buceros rhinoceros silvestris]|uniref:heparan sulfate 2-O-sulfotransferase 1-like n=1 Tax=Buceros rhinoceros silvestris TaxID=175836 RepID=UPI000528A5D8
MWWKRIEGAVLREAREVKAKSCCCEKRVIQKELYPCNRTKLERAIARHEVREIEQRHTVDGPRQDVMLDEEDDVVIIYNRVPKTASTSFTNIAYDLCAKNKYHVLHINTTKNNPVMSLQDQ